jgi:asparagine synthase (glutamine-hydrolysing)
MTFLATADFSDRESWIAGDFRLDDGLNAASVLALYHRLGPDCVHQLSGDFAFAIWDAEARELFCARDPFGVKPLYYAQQGGRLAVSSSLDAVRENNDLDDEAIRDFLLFSVVLDPARTAFAGVRTLPGGHALRAREGRVEVLPWFTLPVEEPLRFRDRRDVVAQFNALLTQAVADRIESDRVAVSMSGGLDSTSIATVAAEVLRERHGTAEMLAQTIVFDPLVPDDEERFAVAVAKKLGIAHHVIRAADHPLFAKWDLPGYRKSEPSSDPFSAITTDQFRRAAAYAPVLLSGQGGDAVFYASHPYFYDLLRHGRVLRAAGDALSFMARSRRLPPLCLRSSHRRARGIPPKRPPLPAWVHPQPGLRERWDEYWNDLPQIHPTRPQAYGLLTGPGWQRLNEYTDAEAMGAAVSYRSPFLDLRLVRFLLRLPPMPWFGEKELLREAMRGRLPERVRRRRKTPIGIDPAHLWLRRQSDELCDALVTMPQLDRWIDRRLATAAIRSPERSLYDSFLLGLPLSLGFWLRGK